MTYYVTKKRGDFKYTLVSCGPGERGLELARRHMVLHPLSFITERRYTSTTCGMVCVGRYEKLAKG